MPPLRFTEFTGEWQSLKLGNIGQTYNGLTGKNGEDFGKGYPYITYKSIFDSSKIDISRVEYVNITDYELKKNSQNEVQYGDIFFTTSSETPEEVGMASVLLDKINHCYLNSFCFGYRLTQTNIHLPEFMRFYLRSESIRRKLFILAQGSTRFNISKNEAMQMGIMMPHTIEQRKIAQFLTLIDERIATQSKIIEDLKKLKSAITQILYCQNAPNNRLGNIIIQVSTRNRNKNIDTVLSVSSRLGFIEQSEQFADRNVASDDTSNYKIVNRNDFAYNPARINVGSIARLTSLKCGIVSPMYISFRTTSKVLPEYLEYFFETKYFNDEMENRLEGSVRLCLSWEGLCNIPIMLPSIAEQKHIGEQMTMLSDKIVLEKRYIEALKRQKQYLLSMMFI